MKNDYNESSGKIPQYEKLSKKNFEIFSGLVRKWLCNFRFGWPEMCRPSQPIFTLAHGLSFEQWVPYMKNYYNESCAQFSK